MRQMIVVPYFHRRSNDVIFQNWIRCGSELL